MLKLFLVFVCCVSLALSTDCTTSDSGKIDCGYVGINQNQCEAKGCCWASSTVSGVPWCFNSGSGPSSSPWPTSVPGSVPFSDSEMKTMWGYFLNNIDYQSQGGVIASPTTSNADYNYHWSRDGAITMRAVLQYGANFTDVNTKMQKYFNFMAKNMQGSDPNGINMRGEPKFYLPNGPVYNKPWGRPQNDGAGLRAIVLSEWVKGLMDSGKLRSGDKLLSDVTTFIQNDLDYIVSCWQSNTFDLWEEVQSNDFLWTRGAQYYGLVIGSKVLSRVGLVTNNYDQTAQQILSALPNHWNGVYLFESSNRAMDTAVNLIMNHVSIPHEYFNLTGAKFVATLNVFTNTFHNAYTINTADDAKAVPGVLVGRYPGDSYMGGNPWILSTCAMAENYYRMALSLMESRNMPNAEAMVEFTKLLKLSNTELQSMTVHSLALRLSSKGDDMLQRVRYHVAGSSFHLNEQIDRNNGNQASVTDLTWSYGTVITAMGIRAKLHAALSAN